MSGSTANNGESAFGDSAHILVAEDDPVARRLFTRTLEAEAHSVVAVEDGRAAEDLVRSRPFDLVLTDIKMPRVDGLELLRRIRAFDEEIPVVVLTSSQSVPTAVKAIRLGAYDYLQKPVETERLRSVVKHVLEHQRLRQRQGAVQGDEEGADEFHGMVGRCDSMQWIYKVIERVARYPTSVLITGESGTGKELVARAIHDLSSRVQGPFVAVNCAGLTETLFESLLFGHIKGSFTGATAAQQGLMETADGGTLFLDEVGEMAPANQAKLLRVIETREVQRVGSTHPTKIDIRVIAATNRDLIRAIDEKDFREDLYYRLRGITIALPPLRERGDDVRLMANAFLERCNRQFNLELGGYEPSVLEYFRTYPWPGNVRELLQVVTSAAMMSRGSLISMHDLEAHLQTAGPRAREAAPVLPEPSAPSAEPLEEDSLLLSDCERNHVERVLTLAHGNKSKAATLLGVSRHVLYRLLKKHDLE